jgi:CRP/FNR family transcriptional regulator, nitrogen fixation regulation protein
MANAVEIRADGSPSACSPPPGSNGRDFASGLRGLGLEGHVKTLPGGGTIYAQEDEARFVYQVETGVVRTVTARSDGRRIIHEFHLRGGIFGLEPGPRHHCSAETIGETRIVQCPRARVEQAASDDEATARALRFRLLHERNQTAERSACLMYGSAFERLAYFLLDMASRSRAQGPFELVMSRYDIADHLGLASETVSRTFSLFRKHGLIATRGRLVTLLDDRIRPPLADAGWPSDVRHPPLHAAGPPLAELRERWPETGDQDHG